MHILIVEDDDTIASPLATGLERAGYTVTRVDTGEDALRMPQADLVLLDLGLPDLDGSEVCRRMRGTSDVPIIVVTARGEELDRVLLLEIGADDYLVKPFGFRELLARIRAVLRRSGQSSSTPEAMQVQTLGPLVVDRRARKVMLDDAELHLTPKEFDLLAFLAANAGAAISRDEILGEVWDTDWWGSTKTLDVHIASLRRKLGTKVSIDTVRGFGFRLGEPG
ncbi:MAG: DNA-binding response regulator [Actinobacteria bacterium ATB1]|nr:DNA-binding response regulator [Actinobacteria bacterium ATB1]